MNYSSKRPKNIADMQLIFVLRSQLHCPDKDSTSASSMSSWVAMSPRPSQRNETGLIQNGSPTSLGMFSNVLSPNSVGSSVSSSAQGSNPASAKKPSTNLAGTGLSRSQFSTSNSGRGSAPATIGTQQGNFSSGGPGSPAVRTPTSSTIPSIATRTYSFDGIVFIGDSSSPTA